MYLYMQESVEDMGLYEDVSGVAGPSVQVTVTPPFQLPELRERIKHVSCVMLELGLKPGHITT